MKNSMFKNTKRKLIELLHDGTEFEHPNEESWNNSAEKYIHEPSKWNRFYVLKETYMTSEQG